MAVHNVPATVVTELQRQLNQELTAAHSYRALAFWCEAENFKGFACWFGKQAEEEQEHAKKIAAHLLDRGVRAEVGALPAPRLDFKNLLELAQLVYTMETNNTKGIHAVYEAAVAAKDYPAQVLMHWFINEQVEEERWSAEMVERVQGASCAGSLLDLDRHLDKILGDQLFAEAEEK